MSSPVAVSRRLAALGAILVAALVLASGCSSLSDSSESSSAFVSSPVTSLSRSSSPEIAYREDVRDFTESHIQAGGSAESLRVGLAEVASRHGISDWEHNESTYVAIGEGLARADYNRTQVDGFVSVFSKSEEESAWILKGFGK